MKPVDWVAIGALALVGYLYTLSIYLGMTVKTPTEKGFDIVDNTLIGLINIILVYVTYRLKDK